MLILCKVARLLLHDQVVFTVSSPKQGQEIQFGV